MADSYFFQMTWLLPEGINLPRAIVSVRNMPSSTPPTRLAVLLHGEFVYEARTSDADLAVVGRRTGRH
jgi:hypothetical protein